MGNNQDDVFVRLRPDRADKLRNAAELIAKRQKRNIIQNPEAVEILADFYINHKGNK